MIPAEFRRFPGEWGVLPFLQVFKDATSGKIKIKKENFLEEGKLPIVDQGQSHFGGYSNEENLAVDSELPSIVFGDHTRAFKFIEEPFALGADGVKLLEPIVEADKKYLFYYLKQLRLESAGYSRHYKFLKESYIPLPPLSVQKQIAAVLEKADILRSQCQQMEQELNALAQSVFLDMFGDPVKNPKNWESKKLKDIVSIQSGATPSKGNDSFWKGDFPWVSPKDMKSTYISNSIDHISESVFKETNLKRISKNTILIVVRGMILVHTVPVAITIKNVSINQDIKAMKVLDDSIEPLYLLWCLKSQHDHILGKVSTAAHGTKRLDMPDLVGLDICVPPHTIQQNFVNLIRKLDQQLEHSKMLVSDHESNFQSLMQRAFKGELELKGVA